MANELLATTATALTLYGVLLNSTGQAYNTATPGWETIEADNWTDYDIALSESEAPGVYLGDMPAVVAGVYTYVVYSQAGASPATSDTVKGTGTLDWTGTDIFVCGKYLDPLIVTQIQSGLSTLTAADVNAEVVDALTVDVIADSVSTDGSRPTIAQALLMIARYLMEREVSSTTVTVNKEDGTTAAMTFTLDSATAPTSITRVS